MDQFNLDFIRKHKGKLAGKLIEVGAKDENGTVRSVVDVTVGVDMRPGKCVDLVCDVKDLPKYYPHGYFDACISANTLEHVEDWKAFCRVTWDLVKNDGWLLITMASLQKGYHGYPHDYIRLTEGQIKTIYPNAEYSELGRVSVGWIVQKRGDINLDIVPLSPRVKQKCG